MAACAGSLFAFLGFGHVFVGPILFEEVGKLEGRVHGLAADAQGIEREEIELAIDVELETGLDDGLCRPFQGLGDGEARGSREGFRGWGVSVADVEGEALDFRVCQ